MKPYIELDELSIKRSLDFVEKCEELELDNACFIYNPKRDNEVKFWLVKHADYWGLTVIQNLEKKRDIYKIRDNQVTFDYSEND
jgi:hypothetical protein